MSITLHTAPDCLRCKIVKGFLAEHQIAYETVDFKADAQTFNTFYRANRKAIYRNPEAWSFRCSTTARSSSRLRGSHRLPAVRARPRRRGHAQRPAARLDFRPLPFPVPGGGGRSLRRLVQQLAKGGLTVCIQTDGRNPALLERLIGLNALAKVQLNIPGPASVYEALYGSAPTKTNSPRPSNW